MPGHQHVRRLAELRKDLQAQARRRDISPLIAGIGAPGRGLAAAGFWLAAAPGLVGAHHGQGPHGGRGIRRVSSSRPRKSPKALVAQAQALQKSQQDRPAAVTARCWSWKSSSGRSTRSSIRARAGCTTCAIRSRRGRLRPPTSAGQQQISDDAARCEILVARLKTLRAVSSAAQQAHQQAQGAAARRAALLQC